MSGRFQAPHTPSGAEEAPGFGKEETTDTENVRLLASDDLIIPLTISGI
jgi:hypothetical protein